MSRSKPRLKLTDRRLKTRIGVISEIGKNIVRVQIDGDTRAGIPVNREDLEIDGYKIEIGERVDVSTLKGWYWYEPRRGAPPILGLSPLRLKDSIGEEAYNKLFKKDGR